MLRSRRPRNLWANASSVPAANNQRFVGRRNKCLRQGPQGPHRHGREQRPKLPLKSATWHSLSEADRTRRVLSAFQGKIETVSPPIGYRLGIAVAALTMLVLPIIYLLIIVAVGFGVYYHLVHNVGMLEYGSGRAKVLVFLAYLAPLVAGGVTVIFMFKPLFARPARRESGRSVTAKGEPVLFKFVEQLCETVGAPMPQRIDVDCDVNASASFRRGWWSILSGNDLVLTIGMPFVAGLNMRQFAGVLAHEFGHFSQGAGMRLTYIVRTISFWFQRVVYERDHWDERLAAAAEGLDIRIGWVVYLAQAGVWLSRRVLWCLMMIGNLVSSVMLRQMEFDADRYEARFAGSDVFESTCRRIGEIGAAYQMGIGTLQRYFDEGKLTDNFPALIHHNLDGLSDKVQKQLSTGIDQSATGWLDTHPADKDRIASAHREQAKGVFTLESPASHLFTHWNALCKNVTWDFYRSVIGNNVQQNMLRPIGELLRERKKERASLEALQRFMLGSARTDRRLQLPPVDFKRSANPKAILVQLKSSRAAMQDEVEAYRKAGEKWDESLGNFFMAEAARIMIRAKIVLPKELAKIGKKSSEAAAKKEAAETTLRRASVKMEAFESAISERIAAAVKLLFEPAVVKRLPDAKELQTTVTKVLPAAVQLSAVTERLREIQQDNSLLAAMLGQIERYPSNEILIDRILSLSGDVARRLKSCRDSMGRTDYPFDHADKGVTLGAYLIANVPLKENVGEVHHNAADFSEKHTIAFARALSTLADVVERVEKACALKPLTQSA